MDGSEDQRVATSPPLRPREPWSWGRVLTEIIIPVTGIAGIIVMALVPALRDPALYPVFGGMVTSYLIARSARER